MPHKSGKPGYKATPGHKKKGQEKNNGEETCAQAQSRCEIGR